MRFQSKRILITGGSSGIGLELARQLASQGAELILTGRRPEPLEQAARMVAELGAAAVRTLGGDIADEQHRQQLVAFVTDGQPPLDVLVNNAGGVRAGRLEDISEDELRRMIEVDLLAPILLTRALLPALRASGDGFIVNIASGIAQVGVPFYSGYAAAKGGLARFGEALRRELLGEGVHLLTVYPGATDTPMMASNEAGADLGFARQPVAEVVASIVEGMETGALEVVRGGATRRAMLDQNWNDPQAVDRHFAEVKARLLAAVASHNAL